MWALLLALAAAAGVQGGQYGDYGAVKMPAYAEYEAPPDAYRPRAPPAADDYDNKGITDKLLSKDYTSGGTWHKPGRKQAKRTRSDDEYSERERGGERRERPLGKGDGGRARSKHKRDPDEGGADDEEFSIEKYIRGINENNLEADEKHPNRKTTDRIIRRKPRDRNMGPSGPAAFRSEDFDDEAALNSGDQNRAPSPFLKEIEVPSGSDDILSEDRAGPRPKLEDLGGGSEELRGRAAGAGRGRRPAARGGDEASDSAGEDGAPPRLRPAQRARLEPGGGGADYDHDFYDLKRLQNMRDDIKAGYRRRPEHAPEVRDELGDDDELQELGDTSFAPIEPGELGGRRAFRLRRPKHKNRKQHKKKFPRPKLFTGTSHSIRPITRPATSRRTATSTSPTTTTTTTTPAPTSPPSPPLPSSSAANASQELSLAEKSRLSIMKKASRKEGPFGEPSSTKPPVLLQVTKVMPTVVLVEASVTEDPWMRAREVSGDSPEQLAKVKQLMRSKLVANAKDIRDLTEDWDQLVCDYVDVTLLESAAPRHHPHPAHAALLALALCAVSSCDVLFFTVSYIYKCILIL